MQFINIRVWVAASLLACSAASAADDNPAGGTSASSASTGLDEIVVTARRRSEVLQDVPQVVTAVTPTELQQLNLQNMQDLSGVVPGLEISQTGGQFNDNDTLRGVTFNPNTGTQNSVAFYLNDVFVTNNFVTGSNYDVGQIEVQSGPQGTLRGEPAPSGSLTLTTRRPDLEQFGGYVNLTATNLGNFNENGAVNLPIIQDKLAVRLAGIANVTHYNEVRSIDNGQDPYFDTYGERVSIRFVPIDSLEANLTYQHSYTHQSTFEQMFGSGSPGGTYNVGGIPVVAPANYNGPPISPFARLSAQSYPDVLYNRSDIVTLQLDWHVAGQVISYDGSWWEWALRHGGNPTLLANQVPAINAADPIPSLFGQYPYTTQYNDSHELRIASETPLFGGLLDYTAGLLYRKTDTQVDAIQSPTFLPGSFGSPLAAPNPNVYDPAYTLQVDVQSPSAEREVSEFLHVTFHLPDDTELTAGGRHLGYTKSGYTEANLLTADASIAVPLAFPCSVAHLPASPYPGVCNLPASVAIPNPTALPLSSQDLSSQAWIYNISLSHKLDPDFLVYASSGSSWRPPAESVGIYNAANDPTLNSLLHLKTETSIEFEGGFKWTFLEHRARLNATFYHQKFDHFIYAGLPVIYLQDNGSTTSAQAFTFNSNPNAVVNGVDLDSAFQIMPRWNFDFRASYANGHLTGSNIPCNPPSGGTTAAAFPAGTYVFLCPSHASTSTAPNFNFSASSEYDQPLPFGTNVNAFVRGLYVFYGSNSHASEFYVTPSYGILNLFTGMRSSDGAWEVALFAKNALNTQRILIEGYPQLTNGAINSTFGPSGYSYVGSSGTGGGAGGITPRQEFGITLTYAIGSR